MNTPIKKDIKKLLIQLILIYSILIFFISFFVFHLFIYNKKSMADIFVNSIEKSLLIRDLREVTLIFNKISPKYFDRVVYISKSGEIILNVPPSSKDELINENIFTLSIAKKIFDNNNQDSSEQIIFIYKSNTIYVSLFFIWLFGLGTLFFTFKYFKNEIQKKYDNEISKNKAEVIFNMAQQVAHDIRSPLTALNMILSQTNSLALPEQSRILIRQSVNRINDIANSLLNQGKATSKQNNNDSSSILPPTKLESTMLASLIDSVVSEKRVALRDKSNLQIEARLEKSYGLFAKINPIEMKRLLSNAINNSAEGIETPNQGLIEVILDSTKDKIILTIKDNGKGIPPHILAKLGTQGVTHGKEGTQSGSGLGVYHAKKTIESFGGHYEIQSTVGEGTSVILSLKKEEPPNWFVQKLLFEPEQYVVATDDDHSILEIWRQRFAHSNINLLTFTTSQSLKQWTLNNKEIAQNAIFLMDYELLGQTETGLDLIEELKLNQNENAILVSSRFEEPQVKERCSKLSVKMIPKGLASLVPFETKAPTAPKVKYDLCLIDDDRALIHTTWNFVAQSKGLNIKLFATPDEFLEDANNIDRSTPIYIDVSLGNGIKGTDFAKEVHQLGFKEINLATGYDADSIEVPHFISKTVGKDFPNI